VPRLADIIEAIERIRRVLDGVTLQTSANKRRDGERGGLDWRGPNGSWCDRRQAASYAA
jgi:hypothetical protein